MGARKRNNLYLLKCVRKSYLCRYRGFFYKRGQPRFYRKTELGHDKLESTSLAEEGMQRKARKSRKKPRYRHRRMICLCIFLNKDYFVSLHPGSYGVE